jgi:hypothetical protein
MLVYIPYIGNLFNNDYMPVTQHTNIEAMALAELHSYRETCLRRKGSAPSASESREIDAELSRIKARIKELNIAKEEEIRLRKSTEKTIEAVLEQRYAKRLLNRELELKQLMKHEIGQVEAKIGELNGELRELRFERDRARLIWENLYDVALRLVAAIDPDHRDSLLLAELHQLAPDGINSDHAVQTSISPSSDSYDEDDSWVQTWKEKASG